jgi:hypothetical protein
MRVTKMLPAAAITLLLTSSADARLLRGGDGMPTFEGPNWHDVLEKVPCQLVTKDGKGLEIAARLIVDGKTFDNPTITDRVRVKDVEGRCFPKRGE